MKQYIVIKLLCTNLLIFAWALTACKKKSRELTTVNFHLYNPASGQGFEGIKVKILRQKQKGSGLNIEFETETVWEGTTGVDGKASHTFKCYNNSKYFYSPSVEKAFTSGTYYKLLTQPDYQDDLDKNEVNEVVYTATIPASHVVHIKNVNCFDSNDKFRVRYSWQYKSYMNAWTGWLPLNSYIYDCYDSGIGEVWNTYNDNLIYQYEVERNGTISIHEDTFYISPYSVDTLKIFY